MQKVNLYIKDWLAIHPYNRQQPSDSYFVELTNQFYSICSLPNVPEIYKKKLCLYVAAYFEDVISGLGLWQSFVRKHIELYDTPLPFYSIQPHYIQDEVNKEDIRFIIWNTLQKALYPHTYINPMNGAIEKTANLFFSILEKEFETAPANDLLHNLLTATFPDKENAERILSWLFGHTYLTEPSVQEYIDRITPSDKFIVPCGPLALFLHEWIDLLTKNTPKEWKKIEGLYPPVHELSEDIKQRNRNTYDLFTKGTNGTSIIYLNGYKELHHFLTETLRWPDDENHTLPQMKKFHNFIMMANPEKGILLAKDICECISDPLNTMYNQKTAIQKAFNLLTIPTLCPPDLMEYLISHNYIPDAQLPIFGERELVQKNADFIARHSLLYYYRGD